MYFVSQLFLFTVLNPNSQIIRNKLIDSRYRLDFRSVIVISITISYQIAMYGFGLSINLVKLIGSYIIYYFMQDLLARKSQANTAAGEFSKIYYETFDKRRQVICASDVIKSSLKWKFFFNFKDSKKISIV